MQCQGPGATAHSQMKPRTKRFSSPQDAGKHFATARGQLFLGHSKIVNAVDWSADGQYIASASADMTVRVWSATRHKTGRETVLAGHENVVYDVAWGEVPTVLASAAVDKSVRVWDVRTRGGCTSAINTPGDNISVRWADDHTLVCGNKDELISIIDTRTNRVIAKHTLGRFEINELAFSRDGCTLFASTSYGTVEAVRFPSWEKLYSMQAHTSNCLCLAVSADGKQIASGGMDAMVSLFELSDASPCGSIPEIEHPIRKVAYDCHSEYLAIGSEGTAITLVHAATGAVVYELPTHTPTTALAWSPSACLLAYSNDDRETGDGFAVKVWGFPHSERQ